MTINHWLREVDVLSPKARRKAVNHLNAELRRRKKDAKLKKEKISIENKLEILNRHDAHPRRPRCAHTDELVQLDASPHIYLVWLSHIFT